MFAFMTIVIITNTFNVLHKIHIHQLTKPENILIQLIVVIDFLFIIFTMCSFLSQSFFSSVLIPSLALIPSCQYLLTLNTS